MLVSEILEVVRQTFFCFLPGLIGTPESANEDGESFHNVDAVAVQTVLKVPLTPYNLSTECENVNTGIRVLQGV